MFSHRQHRPAGSGFLPRLMGYLAFSSPAWIAGIVIGMILGHQGAALNLPAFITRQPAEAPASKPAQSTAATVTGSGGKARKAPAEADRQLIFAPPPRPIEKVGSRPSRESLPSDNFPPPTIRR